MIFPIIKKEGKAFPSLQPPAAFYATPSAGDTPATPPTKKGPDNPKHSSKRIPLLDSSSDGVLRKTLEGHLVQCIESTINQAVKSRKPIFHHFLHKNKKYVIMEEYPYIQLGVKKVLRKITAKTI